VRHTRGFTPGWYAVPPWALRTPHFHLSLPASVRAQDRSRGAPHTRSGAGSVRSEPWRRTTKPPRATRESPILPRASSASAGPFPRSAQIRQSGAGSDRSEPWRRTTKTPSRNARKPLLSRASSARVGPFPRSAQIRQSGAGSDRSEPWKRSPKSPARSAKAPPPQSFLSARRTDPAEHPNPSATGLLQTLNNSPESTHQPLTPRVFIDLETRADSPLKKTKQQTDTHP